jgi:hypothetical protein
MEFDRLREFVNGFRDRRGGIEVKGNNDLWLH